MVFAEAVRSETGNAAAAGTIIDHLISERRVSAASTIRRDILSSS
jgi:hypothetical protein